MRNDIWTKAKELSQARGRINDWTYIIGLYRKMGGDEMAITVTQEGVTRELLGKDSEGNLIFMSQDGKTKEMTRDEYIKTRKKFLKRNMGNAEKVGTIEISVGESKEEIGLYEGVEWV